MFVCLTSSVAPVFVCVAPLSSTYDHSYVLAPEAVIVAVCLAQFRVTSVASNVTTGSSSTIRVTSFSAEDSAVQYLSERAVIVYVPVLEIVVVQVALFVWYSTSLI